MGKQLEAIFALIDKASGPGKSIAFSLKLVDDAAEKVDKRSGTFTEKLTRGFGEARKGANALAEGYKYVAGAILAAGAAAGGLLYALGKQVIEASETKQQFMQVLSIVDGIGVSAEGTLDSIKAMANATGQSDAALTQMYIGMRRLGFVANDTQTIMAAALDVKAIAGKEGEAAADAFVKMFERIKTSGEFKFGKGDLIQAGITKDQIAETLKSYDSFKNKSVVQIMGMMDAGQVAADDGMKAILETIQTRIDKGAALGTTGAKILGGSFSGQIQKLKNQFGDLLEDIDLTPLTNLVSIVSDFVKGPAGTEIKTMIAGGFRDFGEAVKSINIAELKSWGSFMIKIAGGAIELGKALFGSVAGGFGFIIAPLKLAANLMDENRTVWNSFVKVVKLVGTVVGGIAAGIVVGVAVIAYVIGGLAYVLEELGSTVGYIFTHYGEGVANMWTAIKEGFSNAMTWFSKLPSRMAALAGEMIDGLLLGLTGGAAKVTGAVTGIGDSAVAAMKGALKIQSPSKVFEQLGSFTVQGFHRGVENEAANTNAIDMDGIAPSVAPSSGAANANGGGITIHSLTIEVVAGPGVSPAQAEEMGRSIAAGFREQLADELEAVRMAAGAEG